jgi:hemerythrin-like domain-containing protein
MMLTDQLKKENDNIRVMLRILNGICGKLDSGYEVPARDLDDIFELIRVLVQRLHQKKEEDLLLATMEGSPVDEHGALAALLLDHRAIRRSFQAMRESIARYHAGDQDARPVVSERVRLYTRQLSEHLETAEKDLYVRADMHLSRKKQAELAARFDRLDRAIAEEDERLRKLAKLRQMYLQ